MVNVCPDYLGEFRCLMGACPDTCCGQWEIVVDEAARERYLAVEGPLGERIRAALTVRDGEDCMVLMNGKCPLLTEEGLCPIVMELGEEFLCETCHAHPRFTEVYGGYRETMLSVSCPAAARLLLDRREKLEFVTTIDGELPEPTDLDGDLFFLLRESRRTVFKILQDRSLPLGDRLALVLCLADRLERNVENVDLCLQLCELYENPGYQERQLARVKRLRRYGTMTMTRQVLGAMEHLGDQFPAAIRELERPELETDAVALEQLAVYFFFRWWLKAACNGYLWRQAAAAVVSVLSVAALKKPVGSLEEAARLYSKEVEHSEENLALLRRAMELPAFTRDMLLRLV